TSLRVRYAGAPCHRTRSRGGRGVVPPGGTADLGHDLLSEGLDVLPRLVLRDRADREVDAERAEAELLPEGGDPLRHRFRAADEDVAALDQLLDRHVVGGDAPHAAVERLSHGLE